ncbi:DNA translocase [Candidatus Photodesmus blepharus]|uniref:DNA translocase FtsK n=1 Tax=Candidatus Photodesmus blepharonis TaxID=1179155 RepID=A0A084CP33_9GAMM|nr:DNA translocase [Candidatus Photodesmus blepharus]
MLENNREKAITAKTEQKSYPRRLNSIQRLKECLLILAVLSSVLLSIALYTFNPADPSWSQVGWVEIKNADGTLGAWAADTLFFTFGSLAYTIPIFLIITAWRFLRNDRNNAALPLDLMLWGTRILGFITLTLTSCGLADINFDDIWYFSSGGVIGDVLTNLSLPTLNILGTILVFLFLWGAGFTLLTGISWLTVVECLGEQIIKGFTHLIKYIPCDQKTKRKQGSRTYVYINFGSINTSEPTRGQTALARSFDFSMSESSIERIGLYKYEKNSQNQSKDSKQKLHSNTPLQLNKSEKRTECTKKTIQKNEISTQNFDFIEDEDITTPMPTLELLYQPEKCKNLPHHENFENISRLIEKKLEEYKIKSKVVAIFPGPVITRFELELAPGIKASRISSLSMDLTRSLSTTAVRIVEVIPGKPYIGLELPNTNRKTIYFSDVVGSQEFIKAESPTSIVLGQGIAGDTIVADLSEMPHVLLAGTTGSGKSVGVNAMILSMLYKATPEDVKFIMIDPKMLELSIYEGIPHLLSKVVTNMEDASNALNWCIGEMESRYKLMSALGVRNIKGFNNKLKIAHKSGNPIPKPSWYKEANMNSTSTLKKLPYIVIIIDELSDLMLVVGRKIEEMITRLAQKSRAAGIHLILATQRPSVDVITGVIKANIPTRIAFTVSTRTDSRIILDQGGAESLLGMGDMLYLPSDSSHTIRIHGTFAPDDDVHAVVNNWKGKGKPNYIDKITNSERSDENSL